VNLYKRHLALVTGRNINSAKQLRLETVRTLSLHSCIVTNISVITTLYISVLNTFLSPAVHLLSCDRISVNKVLFYSVMESPEEVLEREESRMRNIFSKPTGIMGGKNSVKVKH
jgi:hypothetical protein